MFRSDNAFGRFMSVLGDVVFVGILWMIATIPVVTAGGAATAAYYAMSKSVRHKTGYLWKEFFYSLKSNLKQSIILTITLEMILLILGLDIFYVWTNNSKLNSVIFMVLLLILFIVAGTGIYLWPLLSRFEKKNLEFIKTAVVILFKYLPLTMGLLVLLAVCGVGIYLMPWAVLVIPGIYLYILTFPLEWILKKMMPVPEEGSEEAQKWYYQ